MLVLLVQDQAAWEAPKPEPRRFQQELLWQLQSVILDAMAK
jgi:hypothetical protein